MNRAPAAPRPQPLHVLVVDDDAGAGRMLADALDPDLFAVLAVPDAQAAVGALHDRRFGIALIDIG
ncbi:MAG TPA: response regulator, partial [Myxococcota bacterium]|nr:response regulator [Myxococcota bacterium]